LYISEELRAEEGKGAVSKWYSNKGERERGRERAAAAGAFINRLTIILIRLGPAERIIGPEFYFWAQIVFLSHEIFSA
jgi:hypothetical protein